MIAIHHLDWADDEDTEMRDLRFKATMPGLEGNQVEAVRVLAGKGLYKLMCEVDTDRPEYAYKLTQNGVVTDSWTLEPPQGLKVLVAPIEKDGKTYGHRSTSMGDVMIIDNKVFVVATFGFEDTGLTPDQL